jgi:hypothetical protein
MEQLKTFRLHFLLGKWTGNGSGKFPTITSFNYTETLTFNFDGVNDLIQYEQRTWLTPNNTPSHWESGFIKPVEGEENVFEISNSQDSGRVEVLRGEYSRQNGSDILHFKMKLIQNDPRMVSSERIFTIQDNQLSYVKKMATQNTPEHQQHLQATLYKNSND